MYNKLFFAGTQGDVRIDICHIRAIDLKWEVKRGQHQVMMQGRKEKVDTFRVG